jgi:hypothetical protein
MKIVQIVVKLKMLNDFLQSPFATPCKYYPCQVK